MFSAFSLIKKEKILKIFNTIFTMSMKISMARLQTHTWKKHVWVPVPTTKLKHFHPSKRIAFKFWGPTQLLASYFWVDGLKQAEVWMNWISCGLGISRTPLVIIQLVKPKKPSFLVRPMAGCVALLSNVPRKIYLRALALGGGREANLSLLKQQVAPSIKHLGAINSNKRLLLTTPKCQ